jgi:hypothetical protein
MHLEAFVWLAPELVAPSFVSSGVRLFMVHVSIHSDRVRFEVEGWDKLWALKSQLEIPVAHIRAVRADPEPARGWWHGLRLPGTQVPGILTAGTFYQSDGFVFYDVHDPERTVVIDLDHEQYQRLVIEVANPAEVVERLRSVIATAPPNERGS